MIIPKEVWQNFEDCHRSTRGVTGQECFLCGRLVPIKPDRCLVEFNRETHALSTEPGECSLELSEGCYPIGKGCLDKLKKAMSEKCFACGKVLKGQKRNIAFTEDGQSIFVGSECYKRIGDSGYQPPLGGPKLWRGKTNVPPA